MAFLVPARAQLVVGVSGGNFKPISIAVRQFLSADGLGKDISDIISADLERSGLFRPLDSSLFLEENKGPNVVRLSVLILECGICNTMRCSPNRLCLREIARTVPV